MSGTPALVDPFPIADADIRSWKWGRELTLGLSTIQVCRREYDRTPFSRCFESWHISDLAL